MTQRLTRTQRKWLIKLAVDGPIHLFPHEIWEQMREFNGYLFCENTNYDWAITEAGLEALASYEADEETGEPAGESGGGMDDLQKPSLN
jgi:hypothetical protein